MTGLTSPDPMTDDDILDVFGIGFGPANLALAIALQEFNESVAEPQRVRMLFADRHPRPLWHPGMLLDDAEMQVSFLKDLATFRNPQSRFTFVSFLKSRDRLADFVNRGSTAPLRLEFAAYLAWAADQLTHLVRHGLTVRSVEPVLRDGQRDHFLITGDAARGPFRLRARRLVVATGLQPHWPAGLRPAERIWHTAELLPRLDDFRVSSTAPSLVVAGAGQSAAEAALHLYHRFPEATVHLVSPQFGLAPADQGPLVNQIFDPDTVDLTFGASEGDRAALLRMHRNTNYAVASRSVIQSIFDVIYRDRWLGTDRFLLHRLSRVRSADVDGDRVRVEVVDQLTRRTETVAADALVLGTGYRPFDPTMLLDSHGALLPRDHVGRVLVDRDCRVPLAGPGRAELFLVGQTEHQHGLAATLLSVVAVRAGEIADALIRSHLADLPEPHLVPHGVVHA